MKVYLAGPDVFRTDSVTHGTMLKQLCESAGLTGLYPLDNCIPDGLEGAEAAAWICQQNMAMIAEADAVIANLSPFRGHEPDSGTVFEVGVAVALGKPVFAYFDDHSPMREQIPTDTSGRCEDGLFVEDFDLPKNLMLACQWAGASTTAVQAIQIASNALIPTITARIAPMSKKQTLVCPTDSRYRIELDASEIYPDDPGNGTPAMVYGPTGASGTYECVLDNGEMDSHSGAVEVPPSVQRWLDDMFDHVSDFLDDPDNQPEAKASSGPRMG